MNSEEYIEGAVRTNSHRYDVSHVDDRTIFAAFTLFVAAGRAMDAIKRALYYGREFDKKKFDAAMSLADAALDVDFARGEPHNVVEKDAFDLPGYKAENPSVDGQIVHAAVGLATESAEVVEAVLKGLKSHNPSLDFRNLFEELGDLCWYQALALKTASDIEPADDGASHEWTFESLWDKNLAKLKARYPEKFNTEHAFNRDLQKENDALGKPVEAK